jgi:hypothetical protein
LNLLMSVYPRRPRTGRQRFPIRRNADPDDFTFIGDIERDLETLPERCAMFSRILWWKTMTLQIAYVVSMLTLIAAGVLLFGAVRRLGRSGEGIMRKTTAPADRIAPRSLRQWRRAWR